MKTVAELARELNISTQAIYKKINKTMKNELHLHIKTIDGQKFIDEVGEKIMKSGLQPPDLVASQVANQTIKEPKKPDILNDNHLQPVASQVANQYIYRFINSIGDILYIGLTSNLHKRINIVHFSGKGHLTDECYLETEKVEYTLVKDGENPKNKENYYIRKYKPIYNKSIGYISQDIIYNDEWHVFNFKKNTKAILKKNIRAAKLEESNKFFMEQNKALLKELEREREHSRSQSDKIANLAEQLAELARNNQILLGAEQSRTNPALLTTINKTEKPEQDKEQPVKKKSLKSKPFWNIFKKS